MVEVASGGHLSIRARLQCYPLFKYMLIPYIIMYMKKLRGLIG